MAYSASSIVAVNVSLTGTGPQPAAFGYPVFLFESAVSPGSRLHGPFVSASDVVDFGYTSGSAPHLWAQAVMSQNPRVSQFYIGRRDAADADDGVAFDAIVAEDPGAGYIWNSALRDAAETLALAAAVEASEFPKILIAQSNDPSLLSGTGQSWTATGGGVLDDGTWTLTFTGYGLPAPVNVTTTRAAGAPATLDLVLAALATELTTQTAPAGTIEGVVVAASIASDATTISFQITDGLPTGTVTASATSTNTFAETLDDADIGSELFNLQYARTALLYYPTDTVYADGGWSSRCGSFDLDVEKGIWAHKKLNGIAGSTTLTNLQKTALDAVNANYFAPAITSGGQVVQSFTGRGWMGFGASGAGRRIDVTISLDWLRARLQEAGLAVLLSAPNGVLATPAGVNKFTTAFNRVLRLGVTAGHLMDFVVPEGEDYEGTSTPAIFPPDIRSQTAAQRASRTQTWSILCYLAPYIEAVVVNVTVNQ